MLTIDQLYQMLQQGAQDGQIQQDVGEVVPEQDEADESVRGLQQALCAICAGMPRIREVAQTVAVERHDRGFGRREVGGGDDQRDEGGDEPVERDGFHRLSRRPAACGGERQRRRRAGGTFETWRLSGIP